MKSWMIFCCLILAWGSTFSQNFDLVDKQDTYQSGISETLRIPFRIRNNTDKAQVYVIRKVQDDLNSTQKGYFCFDKTCLEPDVAELTKKVEAGETVQNLYFNLETGLITGQHGIRFEIFPQDMPGQSLAQPVVISIGEKSTKALVFQSKVITVHDVYPNPVSDQASIEYNLHNDLVKAKVVIHNILGKALSENELPAGETKVKIQTDELPAGVYFYTVYLNNEGVFTRKLIVRK